jgi:ABC-type Fe3+-hydroxamate transport system substrate-binding protein
LEYTSNKLYIDIFINSAEVLVTVNAKLLTIIIVVIVVVAGIGVAFTMLGNNNKEHVSINAQLEVFGNADNNDKIDGNDISTIEKIIAGDLKFEDLPLADANHDGKVDQMDVEQVKAIIGATSSKPITIFHINHLDGNNVVVETKYPITSAVSTGAANTILIFKYLGIVNEIKGFSWSTAPDSNMFPEYSGLTSEAKRLETSSTRMNVDKVSNLVTSDKVTAVITADNRSYLQSEEKTLEAMGVDVVRVQPASVHSDEYMSTILLIAFLFDTDGKGYMNKCSELISWYENFLTDLNDKLGKISKKVSAVTSSSNTAISTASSDYTEVLTAAGAYFPLTDIDSASASANYNGKEDTWLNKYDIDFVISIRTSTTAFSWYAGEAETKGKTTLTGYIGNFNTLECYEKGNVYVLCGEMPVMIRIAYAAQILYPEIFGDDYGYDYHVDFVKKFFGWNEDTIKDKPFFVSVKSLEISA